MSLSEPDSSRIAPRKCGGWLALVAVGDRFVGVTADTEDAVRSAARSTAENWRRTLEVGVGQTDI